MIPGVIRGVIASSWLRASDQLRAPNGVTTGQNIPPVCIVEFEFSRNEFWTDVQLRYLSQQPKASLNLTVGIVSSSNPRLNVRLGIVTLSRKP